MSKIEIDAHGRKVTVEHDGELQYLADTAQRLWDATDGPQRLAGPYPVQSEADPC